MKKQKNNQTFDKYSKVPLIPSYLLMPLWFISLALPNLIYSGTNFADTLHILKWTVTGVPIAIAAFIIGVRMLIYGRSRMEIKIDIFALMWALILIYCALQPLWVKIFSPTGYVLEMVCFATIWAFYVITASSFPEWGLRPVLILANINAAINTLFAELQIRNLNDFSFLQGTFLKGLQDLNSIILPTPGNYIGNTAQQNMFGLWVAVATLGAVYLFVFDLPKIQGKARKFLSVFVLFLCAVNFWGLMNSTSRSATLALLTGLTLMLIVTLWKFNRDYLKRFGIAFLVLAAVFWASLYSPRSSEIVDKTVDIIEHAETIGLRRGIWTTSYAMAKEHPEGVGIGQYKWHYIEAQRYGFKIFDYDWYEWQYTHWAHNEFLQFFCEGGIIGGVMFLIMYLTWFLGAAIGLFRKETLNVNAVWAICLASLITFCAIFTRPFHRIENMVWITLAFAISNREFFPTLKFKTEFNFIKTDGFRKLIGAACIISSIAGCVYISSGIYGNYILRRALVTRDAGLQLYLLEESAKHPIVREEAQRNIGYHYLQVGEQTDDRESINKGFIILWEHFNREPHSEDIGRILEISQRYQVEDVLREVASYFKPGTYHLERRLHKNTDGSLVNALLLANGPGEDDY